MIETTPQARLAQVQGVAYLATGIWPIIHRRSFEAVTGPKTDFWLVRTVGALISVIGATLLLGSRRSRWVPELTLLAAGSALSLAIVDIVGVAVRRISPVYLLDAVGELALVAAWTQADAVRPTQE
ncbi:MAG: hypothetical protein M3Z20_16015 [Chloroflexota bacterium]|nr:hypothetical protein [Chloroflexota bacterium]